MKRLNFNIKDRKVLTLGLCLILVCVFTLTIAYAALNAVLTISGNAQVVASSWDIKLSNPKVKSGSATTAVPTISGNTLTFNTTLSMPGDYYEFTVDVVNNGSIDAMISSVVKNPELTAEQAKYLKYEITYQNGEAISNQQLLSKNTTMPIKVRIEYRKDLVASDLPSTNTTLNMSLTLEYTQSNGNASSVPNNGVGTMISANGSLDAIGTIVTIGSEQFYTIGTEGDNVKLLSMYNLMVGNEVNIDSEGNPLVTPLTNPTGIQNQAAVGLKWDVAEDVPVGFPWYGTVAFATEEKHGTNYSEYSGSLIEEYVNNYKNILESNYGVEIEEARLITYDELTSEDIGCIADEYSCLNAPSFIYSTSYWSGSADYANDVWCVSSGGTFGTSSYGVDNGMGVRPVIIVSKSLF